MYSHLGVRKMTRLESIKMKVEKWLSGSLNSSQEDLMPDILYLLELIDEMSNTK